MSTAVLREVRLYGPLGRQFGRVFRLAVATPAEAVHALRMQLQGFERSLLAHQAGYHVFVGRGQRRTALDAGQVADPLGAGEPIRIVPAVVGAKRGGLFNVILGAALLALTFWNPLGLFSGQFAALSGTATIGKALLIGGALQLISPQPKGGNTARPENVPSYGFDGAVNVSHQGAPVPLAYGRVVVGSVTISQGMSAEDIVPPPAPPAPAPPPKPAYQPDYPLEFDE